jgi:hypothetical protein
MNARKLNGMMIVKKRNNRGDEVGLAFADSAFIEISGSSSVSWCGVGNEGAAHCVIGEMNSNQPIRYSMRRGLTNAETLKLNH